MVIKSLSSQLDWKLEIGSNSDSIKGVTIEPSNKIESIGIELNFNYSLLQTDSDKLSDPIYWSAPSLFTGNKVTSYGGSISYKLRLTVPPNANSVNRPDLILIGQNISLTHTSLRQPANADLFENKIDLIESQFSHLLSGSSATREHLMIVLSSLKEIRLRATFYNRLHYSHYFYSNRSYFC